MGKGGNLIWIWVSLMLCSLHMIFWLRSMIECKVSAHSKNNNLKYSILNITITISTFIYDYYTLINLILRGETILPLQIRFSASYPRWSPKHKKPQNEKMQRSMCFALSLQMVLNWHPHSKQIRWSICTPLLPPNRGFRGIHLVERLHK